jgi:hypothetical protein
MRRDGSAHLGYYRAHARQLGPCPAPWQRRFARSMRRCLDLVEVPAPTVRAAELGPTMGSLAGAR